jgi:hypothetical protein
LDNYHFKFWKETPKLREEFVLHPKNYSDSVKDMYDLTLSYKYLPLPYIDEISLCKFDNGFYHHRLSLIFDEDKRIFNCSSYSFVSRTIETNFEINRDSVIPEIIKFFSKHDPKMAIWIKKRI